MILKKMLHYWNSRKPAQDIKIIVQTYSSTLYY